MLVSTPLPSKPFLLHFPTTHSIPPVQPLLPIFRVTATAAPTICIHSFKTQSSSLTLYRLLHIHHTGSPTEIKAAYRSLAKLYHPDTASSNHNGGRFIEIHNAYATLSNPVARANYYLSICATSAHHHSRCSASNNIPGFWPTRRWETDQCW